jgi:hypothetical protein
MAAMIAEMSGEGTGGGRSNWRALRRIVLSIVCALLVVMVGSRFNRPSRMGIADQLPRVADRVLPNLQLDTTSLAALVDSINSVAARTARLESAHLNVDDRQSNQWPSPPPMRNVRLGTALAVGTQSWHGYNGGVELREENGALFIDGRGSATTPAAAARLYDVRDLLAQAEAWSKPLRPLHPRPSRQQGLFAGGGGGGAGLFSGGGGGDQDYEPLRATEIAATIRDTIYPQLWDNPPANWHAQGWGGWVFVYASSAAQLDVEQLLALLRRGESQPFRQKVIHR